MARIHLIISLMLIVGVSLALSTPVEVEETKVEEQVAKESNEEQKLDLLQRAIKPVLEQGKKDLKFIEDLVEQGLGKVQDALEPYVVGAIRNLQKFESGVQEAKAEYEFFRNFPG